MNNRTYYVTNSIVSSLRKWCHGSNTIRTSLGRYQTQHNSYIPTISQYFGMYYTIQVQLSCNVICCDSTCRGNTVEILTLVHFYCIRIYISTPETRGGRSHIIMISKKSSIPTPQYQQSILKCKLLLIPRALLSATPTLCVVALPS